MRNRTLSEYDIERMQKQLKEMDAKIKAYQESIREHAEVPAFIMARLKETNRTKKWFAEQMGFSRPTLDARLKACQFTPLEVQRIEAILQ